MFGHSVVVAKEKYVKTCQAPQHCLTRSITETFLVVHPSSCIGDSQHPTKRSMAFQYFLYLPTLPDQAGQAKESAKRQGKRFSDLE